MDHIYYRKMWIIPIIFLAIFSQIDCETVKVVETPMKAFSNDEATNSEIDDLFKKFLEQLKEVLTNGSTFFGIPPLDPYKSGPVNESINLEDIKGDISANSISVFDLSIYDVDEAEIKGPILKMAFHWAEIRGNITAFNIENGRLMNFVNVFGNGDAIYTLSNLKFSTQINFEMKNRTITMENMESQVSLGGLKFFTVGLYNNSVISEEMSAVISKIGPEFIKTYEKNLTDALNKRVMDTANKFLSIITFNDLLNIAYGKIP